MNKSKIPKGSFCYESYEEIREDGELPVFKLNGVCPYWSINPNKPKQNNGYCSFLKYGDWEGISIIWDQVKACNENIGDDPYGLNRS